MNWNYTTKPTGEGDARKLVTLKLGGLVWVGIRAWHHQGQYWQNNGEPIHGEVVTAWRDLPSPAKGFWLRGILYDAEGEEKT